MRDAAARENARRAQRTAGAHDDLRFDDEVPHVVRCDGLTNLDAAGARAGEPDAFGTRVRIDRPAVRNDVG